MSIYVETSIAVGLEEVWRVTQMPELHARWDLRFTGIEYLPKNDGEPQRFRYSTRIGFGMTIIGEGESVATRRQDSTTVSSLKFWSDDPKSLIHTGSGYWQYEEAGGRTKFVTGYDYSTRFGFAGKLFDRLVFRPLLGWATAWSFDSMRLWLEKGISPEFSRQRAFVYLLARIASAFTWIYQGLVPKILFPGYGELANTRAMNMPWLSAETWTTLFGVSEIVFGALIILLWRARWLLKFQTIALFVLVVVAFFIEPGILAAPFNPVTLNVLLIVLGIIALAVDRDLPSARNCLRVKGKE